MVNADQIIHHVLPQFFPAHWLDHPGIAFTPFPSRIRIGYVLREEGCYSYILEEQLPTLGIRLHDLHVAAMSNLAHLPTASMHIAKVPGGAEGWISATDDNFAGVRILLPDVQQKFRDALGEEFFVTLPHRDDCFCWSVSQPAERQESHARDAVERFLQDDYNLTPDVLLYSRGIFRLHRQQIAG